MHCLWASALLCALPGVHTAYHLLPAGLCYEVTGLEAFPNSPPLLLTFFVFLQSIISLWHNASPVPWTYLFISRIQAVDGIAFAYILSCPQHLGEYCPIIEAQLIFTKRANEMQRSGQSTNKQTKNNPKWKKKPKPSLWEKNILALRLTTPFLFFVFDFPVLGLPRGSLSSHISEAPPTSLRLYTPHPWKPSLVLQWQEGLTNNTSGGLLNNGPHLKPLCVEGDGYKWTTLSVTVDVLVCQ